MPKRPKNGPPYTDLPADVYVVVTNPWGMHSDPRQRVNGDFNRIASWAQFALHQAGLGGGRIPTIECIYGMGTRNEIILQFAEGTDIVPLLGEHRWANFAKHCPNPNDQRSTCVFLYNWRNNGDPANHNWSENFPEQLSLDTVPAKSPYPAPSWTSPPSTLTNFVHAIPRPPAPPPILDHGHNLDQEVESPPPTVTPSQMVPLKKEEPEEESVSTNLFRPYEPPAQYPSYAQLLNQPHSRDGEASSSRVSPPSLKFINKLDPYELDEDALRVIRSPNLKQEEQEGEDNKLNLHLSIKAENPEVKKEEDDGRNNLASESESGYQPSQALIDAFNSLDRPEQSLTSARPSAGDSLGHNTATRTIPPASLGYQPSTELEAEVNAFLRGLNTVALLSPDSGARRTSGAQATIKREYEDDAVAPPVERKKIKIEED